MAVSYVQKLVATILISALSTPHIDCYLTPGERPPEQQEHNYANHVVAIGLLYITARSLMDVYELYTLYKKPTLIRAALEGDTMALIDALQHKPDPHSYEVIHALAAASAKNHLKAVRLLLLYGAQVDGAANSYGYTPLMLASGFGHQEVAEELIAHGASLEAKDQAMGDTVLIQAARGGCINVVKASLANKTDINDTNRYGSTALMDASFKGHTEIIEELVDQGARLDDKAQDGRNAIMCAALAYRKKTIQLLLRKGANRPKEKEMRTAGLNYQQRKLILEA